MAKLVAKTYSEALFEAAFELEKVKPLQEEFTFVMDSFREYPALKELYRTPKVTIQERKAAMVKIFGDQLSTEMLNFLQVLLDKRRTNEIEDIKYEFDKMVDHHLGIEKAFVTSARPLTSAQEEALSQQLQKLTGKEVRITSAIDPTLIGGLTIKVGDKILDGSIKKKLGDMGENLQQIIV